METLCKPKSVNVVGQAAARWANRQAYRKMRTDGSRFVIEMPGASADAIVKAARGINRLIIASALALSLAAPAVAGERVIIIDPQPSASYQLGYGIGSLLAGWANASAARRARNEIESTYAVCHGGSNTDMLNSASKLLEIADRYQGEAALRVSVFGLQCRISADENVTYGGDAVAAALERDEALGKMIDAHTTNANTLYLAANAISRVHAAQKRNLAAVAAPSPTPEPSPSRQPYSDPSPAPSAVPSMAPSTVSAAECRDNYPLFGECDGGK